jgi:site-specific recombinase XerD
MRLSDGFDRYKRDVIIYGNQSPKTEEAHEVALKSLLVSTGDIPLHELNFELVRQWKESLQKRGLSPVTIRCYVIKLRVVLAYLIKLKIDCLDPELIAVPKRVTKVPAFLSKEQVAQLIRCTNKIKNKAIVSFLFASGLRISELCSLDRDSIHERAFTVVGKGGKARLCFIDERTETLLNLYLDTRNDNKTALFLTEAGARITPGVVQETFKTIRRRSGIECHPHSLRHSFATNLLQSNTNLYYVSRMLGHQQLTTTQQYLHVVDIDLQKIYSKHHTI